MAHEQHFATTDLGELAFELLRRFVPRVQRVPDGASLIARRASEAEDREVFRRIEATRDGSTFRATLPSEAVAPPLVEYYLEALDAHGLPVAGRGDVAAPLRIAVPAPGGSILASPWFWIITGALVAGAVVTTVLLVGGGGGTAPQPGTFFIDIN